MRGFPKARKNAFTLIELLVTVMILLILAGLILPAIRSARERSRDILCKNNLKQLQVAAMSYAVGGDGSLPFARSTEHYIAGRSPRQWTKYRTGWIDWINYAEHNDNGANSIEPGETPWWGADGLTCITNGTLWQYVKSTKAYSCPEWIREEIVGKKDPWGGDLTFGSTNNPPWRCYAMNSQVSDVNIGDIEASKRLLFTELGNTNFLEDGTTRIAERNFTEKLNYTYSQGSRTEAAGWDGSLSCTERSTSQPWPWENVGNYHRGKANAVFVDGHIEKVEWNVTTNACKGIW